MSVQRGLPFCGLITQGSSSVLMCCRYDINEMVSGKVQLQLVQDEGQSHVMGDLDFKVISAVRYVHVQHDLVASSECMNAGQ